MLAVVITLLVLLVFCYRKQILDGMAFLGKVATGFSDEYNSAYLEPDDEDEDKNKVD